MADLRDKLLTLDRKGLEKEAKKLGLSVTASMSRAELITLIEKQYALQEFGELKTFSEHRFIIVGLFFRRVIRNLPYQVVQHVNLYR